MNQNAFPNSLLSRSYTKWQMVGLVSLRILIGWHFLYEGLAKLLNPEWTAAGFLSESRWLFSGLFTSIIENPSALKIVDFLNVWGLIAIGLGLIVGCCALAAKIAGIFLLLLYYLSNPPFIGYSSAIPSEGNYVIVNKVLIEMAALFVLILFPTSKNIGLDRLIFRRNISPDSVKSD